jgi:glycosyltransferase involved in cell wall biosynthesis
MYDNSYIIITPAFNEEIHIGLTIEGVLAQMVLPRQWIIIDDGSTDQTAEIIKCYAAQHSWIHYVYRPKKPGQSYYSSNVYAIQHGISQIHNSKLITQNSEKLCFDYLAILDADISLPSDYYQKILSRMATDPKLGIASGVYRDRLGENTFRKVLNDRRSTPKALMVFRKECYEAIGGFIPMKYGGEDTCACFTARMKGWKTWSFPNIVAIHNKPIGTGHAKSLLKIRFRQGIGEYFLATHPLFMLLKSLRRCIKEPPYGISGFIRMVGFMYAFFLCEPRQIPDELVRYVHTEQLHRVVKGNQIPSDFKADTSL